MASRDPNSSGSKNKRDSFTANVIKELRAHFGDGSRVSIMSTTMSGCCTCGRQNQYCTDGFKVYRIATILSATSGVSDWTEDTTHNARVAFRIFCG